jgi:hypothetical protein
MGASVVIGRRVKNVSFKTSFTKSKIIWSALFLLIKYASSLSAVKGGGVNSTLNKA